MAVPGKKRYVVYLTPEYYEAVKDVLERGHYKGGISGYFDGILQNTYETLIESGMVKGRPVTAAKLIRLFLAGIGKK